VLLVDFVVLVFVTVLAGYVAIRRLRRRIVV